MRFKISDYVLYNYNVCKIKGVVKIHDNDYYVLSPVEDDSLTIKVPVSNEHNLLKKVMSKSEALTLIKIIPSIEVIDIQDHSLEQEYKRLMISGDRKDLVKIIKTTYMRNKYRKDNGKKLGEKDSNYFELAEKALYDEIAVSLNKTFDDAKKFVIDTINNA